MKESKLAECREWGARSEYPKGARVMVRELVFEIDTLRALVREAMPMCDAIEYADVRGSDDAREWLDKARSVLGDGSEP